MSNAKKSDKNVWLPMTAQQAREALETSVHFFSKATNPNAQPAGVRIGADERNESGLVGFTTTALDRRLTTYSVGAPKARHFNQAMAVLEGNADERYKELAAKQKELVWQAAEVLNEPHVVEGHDPRLRQVLFPVDGGDYVALTPLHSDPFSFELHKRIAEEDRSLWGRRRMLRLIVGGSRGQNVGRRTEFLRRILRFDAPSESRLAKFVFSVHFKGRRLDQLVPGAIVAEFAQEYRELTPRRRELLEWREREELLVRAMAAGAVDEARRIGDVCRRSGLLGNRPVIRTGMQPEWLAGLFDKELQDKAWRMQFAKALIAWLEQLPIDVSGKRLAASGELSHLVKAVEKEIL